METLPFFPLNVVVFPDEELPLHIFEPRYRQLINDCLSEGRSFGMPVYLEDRVQEFGTEIILQEVVNQYPDGRMDVLTKGGRIFRVDSFRKVMPGKEYAGGQVTWTGLKDDAQPTHIRKAYQAAQALFQVMGAEPKLHGNKARFSFMIAHHVGLALSQEYELLKMPSESERLEFLLGHIERMIPIMEDMERTRARIRMNGHFRQFESLDF